LKKAVEDQGDQPAPLDIVVPVKVVGPLWIATIARYSGSMALARDEYAKFLATSKENVEQYDAAKPSVYLYLAEIEADHLKNRKEALAYLQAADELVASNRGEKPPDLGSKWVQYERTKLAYGRAQADRELPGDRDMMSLPILGSIHTSITGLTSHPLSECCLPDVKHELIGKAIVKLVLESDVSKIDKMFMQFSVACYYEKKNAPEAVKRHMELFESDSFISPVAGLYAARIQRNEGRAAEARDIVDRLCARFPQFRSLAKDMEKLER
jgi:tetratricopeptide (TPR) repeat protein